MAEPCVGVRVGRRRSRLLNVARMGHHGPVVRDAVPLIRVQGFGDRTLGGKRTRQHPHVLNACQGQLRRCRLAAFLEGEERRLPTGEDGARLQERLELSARSILRTCVPPGIGQDVAIDDVQTIIHGLIDAAGMRGESDPTDLASRVRRAVTGYLALDEPSFPALTD